MPKTKALAAPAAPPAIPSIPDTSALPVVAWGPMLELKVTDEASAAQAKINKEVAKSFEKSVDAIFEKPTEMAHSLHKWFTTMRGALKSDAIKVREHSEAEATRYRTEAIKQAEALQAKQQAEANRIALEQHAASLAEKDIFEITEEDLAPPAAPIVHVQAPSLPGWGERYQPWSYEVKDLMALVKAIADGTVALYDPFGTPILEVNHLFLKAAAKQYEKDLSTHYPGVEGVREVKVR